MAIEIIRADGTRDEDAFVVIKSVNSNGEVVSQEAVKALQFHMEVEDGRYAVTRLEEVPRGK